MMIEALQKTECKGVAALALLFLSDRADDHGMIRASARQVAEAVGHTQKAVQDALSHLLTTGEVEISEQGRGARPHMYRVINRLVSGQPQTRAETVRQTIEASAIVGKRITNEPPAPTSALTRSPMRHTFRSTIRDLDHLLTWARSADQGAVTIWHIGQVAADRASSAALDEIAEAVHLLSTTAYILPGQHVVTLPAGRQIAYTATRTGIGYVPRSIAARQITVRDYTALRIITQRASDMSAGRALRDGLSVTDDQANRLLAAFARKGLIERGRNGAWVLTQAAEALVP